ncbi:MAG: class I SAM-dependent methyltransferase [Planctomycetota bacterium]
MKLKVIGAPDSHEALIKKMSALSPQRVLDAPAGTGALASKLIEMGHDVHCADIDRQHFQLSGVEHTTADLNHGLPQLDNASFDSVVCCNGAHRLYSLPNAFQEFARILKPGGNLLINVNNYASIDRRLRFLVYGSLDNAVNAQHCNQNITDPAAHVRVALLVPQLINHLTRAGFEMKAINAAS